MQAAVRTGRTLVVAGNGPEAGRLRELAAATPGPGRVLFAGAVSDAELPALYAHCRAFVFPGLEDFGITPLEATAAGRPVVAYRAGGALDTIREGLNGVFCEAQTVDAVAAALADARLDGPWDRRAMQRHAAGFSREVFRDRLQRAVAGAWQRHHRNGGNR